MSDYLLIRVICCISCCKVCHWSSSVYSLTIIVSDSPSGKGVICGHADGSIVRYMFEEEGAELTKVPLQP